MPTTLSDIVTVTAEVRAAGVAQSGHGITLFVASSGLVAGGGTNKVRTFKSAADVSEALGGTSEAYKAAVAHFAQLDTPREFKVARWNKSGAVMTRLVGQVRPASIDDLNDFSAGSFSIGDYDVTGIDLSSATTFDGAATVLQTALRAADATALATATVTYSNDHFRIALPSTIALTNPYLEAHSTGTFIGAALGLDQASGPLYLEGGAQETSIATALTAAKALTPFYFVALESVENGSANMIAAADWCASNRKMFAAESNESAQLTTGESASQMAILSAKQYDRAFGVYAKTGSYRAVAAAARLGAVHLERPASMITMNLKGLAGQVPDPLNRDQAAELDRKNINYYVAFDGGNGFIDGSTFKPGTWMDTRYFLDWLVIRFEQDVFNYMQRAARPISAGIRETCIGVLEQAVRAGGIAPGTVSTEFRHEIQQSFGNPEFDGYLTNGYLLYVPPPSIRTQTERDARILPGVKCWLRGSEAIHYVNIGLVFEN